MASRALPYNVLSVKQISYDRASSCVCVPCALEACILRAREAKSVRYAGKAGVLRQSVDALTVTWMKLDTKNNEDHFSNMQSRAFIGYAYGW